MSWISVSGTYPVKGKWPRWKTPSKAKRSFFLFLTAFKVLPELKNALWERPNPPLFTTSRSTKSQPFSLLWLCHLRIKRPALLLTPLWSFTLKIQEYLKEKKSGAETSLGSSWKKFLSGTPSDADPSVPSSMKRPSITRFFLHKRNKPSMLRTG